MRQTTPTVNGPLTSPQASPGLRVQPTLNTSPDGRPESVRPDTFWSIGAQRESWEDADAYLDRVAADDDAFDRLAEAFALATPDDIADAVESFEIDVVLS